MLKHIPYKPFFDSLSILFVGIWGNNEKIFQANNLLQDAVISKGRTRILFRQNFEKKGLEGILNSRLKRPFSCWLTTIFLSNILDWWLDLASRTIAKLTRLTWLESLTNDCWLWTTQKVRQMTNLIPPPPSTPSSSSRYSWKLSSATRNRNIPDVPKKSHLKNLQNSIIKTFIKFSFRPLLSMIQIYSQVIKWLLSLLIWNNWLNN